MKRKRIQVVLVVFGKMTQLRFGKAVTLTLLTMKFKKNDAARWPYRSVSTSHTYTRVRRLLSELNFGVF